MQIQVSTQHLSVNKEHTAKYVREVLLKALMPYRQHITNVEVHIQDTNGDKNTPMDKQCTIEVHVAKLAPCVVQAKATDLHHLIHSAANKIKTVVAKKTSKRQRTSLTS